MKLFLYLFNSLEMNMVFRNHSLSLNQIENQNYDIDQKKKNCF